MLRQIEHVDLGQQAYKILKELIFKREFKGGQKLDLNFLSREMNISRTPVKDAINQLENDGLVEVIPRKGTYIKKIEVKDIIDMMEMRLMMELWSINHYEGQKACKVVHQLKGILHQSKKLIEDETFDYEAFLNCDSQFHFSIIKACGNGKMTGTYSSMNSSYQIARVFHFCNYERSINTQQEHEQIVQALDGQDFIQAKELLIVHLQTSRDKMAAILKENGGFI